MLNLIQNGLTNLDFLTSKFSVQTLDLSHNDFSHINITNYIGLKETETLALRSCAITSLTTDHGPNMYVSLLQELDLSGNKLVSLDNGVFIAMSNLKKLILNDNPIKHLSTGLQSVFGHIPTVDMSGLTLECDCRLEWLRQLVQTLARTSALGLQCSDTSIDITTANLLTCTRPNVSQIHSVRKPSSFQGVDISCSASGSPIPSVTWKYFYDTTLSINASTLRTSINGSTNVSILTLNAMNKCHHLQCIAENFMGIEFKTHLVCPQNSSSHHSRIEVVANSTGSWKLGWALGSVVVIIVTVTIVILFKHAHVQQYTKLLFTRSSSSQQASSTSQSHLVGDEFAEDHEAYLSLS